MPDLFQSDHLPIAPHTLLVRISLIVSYTIAVHQSTEDTRPLTQAPFAVCRLCSFDQSVQWARYPFSLCWSQPGSTA